MTSPRETIEVKRFANKSVITLPQEASIGEAIRIMYRNGIRHIPVIHKARIVGIINPHDVLRYIGGDKEHIDFDRDIVEIMSQDFEEVPGSSSLYEVVAMISKNPRNAIAVIHDNTLSGIYTESDILDTDFLWANVSDHAITSTNDLGTPVTDMACTTIDSTIHQTLRLMAELHQDYIGILSNDDHDLRGVLSYFEIANHLYNASYRRTLKLTEVVEEPISSIFPSSGVYYIEPVLLSQARKDLWINDSFFTVILDESWNPRRIVTVHDIVGYLFGNADILQK